MSHSSEKEKKAKKACRWTISDEEKKTVGGHQSASLIPTRQDRVPTSSTSLYSSLERLGAAFKRTTSNASHQDRVSSNPVNNDTLEWLGGAAFKYTIPETVEVSGDRAVMAVMSWCPVSGLYATERKLELKFSDGQQMCQQV